MHRFEFLYLVKISLKKRFRITRNLFYSIHININLIHTINDYYQINVAV